MCINRFGKKNDCLKLITNFCYYSFNDLSHLMYTLYPLILFYFFLEGGGVFKHVALGKARAVDLYLQRYVTSVNVVNNLYDNAL